jgi:hypothetical protein
MSILSYDTNVLVKGTCVREIFYHFALPDTEVNVCKVLFVSCLTHIDALATPLSLNLFTKYRFSLSTILNPLK